MIPQPPIGQIHPPEDPAQDLLSTVLPGAMARRSGNKKVFANDVRTVFLGSLRAADILVIALASLLSYWARHGSLEMPSYYWWQILGACLIGAYCLHFARIYSLASLRHRLRHLGCILVAWTATLVAMIVMLYFSKVADEVSRAWMLLWAAASFLGFVGLRIACWAVLASWHRRGMLAYNVALVSAGEVSDQVARSIEEAGKGDVRILGVFRPTKARSEDQESPDVHDLVRLAQRVRVDEIAIAMPCAVSPEVKAAIRTLTTVPADVKLCLDLQETGPVTVVSPAMPVFALSTRPLAGWQIVAKRGMDLTISAVLLLLFAPLMLVIAALVKLDSPGPAIFRQRRFGFNKQTITVYKFRTMYCGSDADPATPQARRDDCRVTRIGRFLRRTSLDELPQFINVVMGGMSLVGPRPHAIAHDERYATLIDGYLGRHRMKPGITGWAQVNGLRGETDTLEKMERRLEHDLFYIDHWSPLFDIRILLMTLVVGFRHPNAY